MSNVENTTAQTESPIQKGNFFLHRTGTKMVILSIENGTANLYAKGWGYISQTVESMEKALADGNLTEL